MNKNSKNGKIKKTTETNEMKITFEDSVLNDLTDKLTELSKIVNNISKASGQKFLISGQDDKLIKLIASKKKSLALIDALSRALPEFCNDAGIKFFKG